MASESDLKRTHPISGLLDGWFFCLREQSAGVYFCEGKDLLGRSVSFTGTDERELLSRCAEKAKSIEQNWTPNLNSAVANLLLCFG
ncbi:hypothetical protein ACE02H_12945 [Shewanella mangrovisoli]|uniref:hypothetical protein n=1 Tax=Shewanella mangrovisoli TaxID=2864211 RepID=UPI0035B8A318